MARDDKPGLLRRGLRRVRGVVGGPRQAAGPAEVEFVTSGQQPVKVSVERHTTVLRAAVAAGLDLDHYCGGTCSCGTCRIEVISGATALSPIQGREQMVLGFESTQSGDRLACQAQVVGRVTIRIPDRF